MAKLKLIHLPVGLNLVTCITRSDRARLAYGPKRAAVLVLDYLSFFGVVRFGAYPVAPVVLIGEGKAFA
jgi:hypothetical protein